MRFKRATTTEEAIFMRICVNPKTHCWEWTTQLTNKGYGTIWADGKRQLAHRVSHQVFKGPIPEGYEVDHLCRVRSCVNPSHLEAVPQRVNWERSKALNAKFKDSPVCRNGHQYTEENTYISTVTGKRECKQCKTVNLRRFYKNHPHYQRDYSKIRRTKT